MKTTRKQNIIAAALACAAAIISVQAPQAQTSRFDELANLPFKENRNFNLKCSLVWNRWLAERLLTDSAICCTAISAARIEQAVISSSSQPASFSVEIHTC